jgi:hypothetical protein
MENSQNLPVDILAKGYILMPKSLFLYTFSRLEKQCSYFSAFLTVVARVNYKDCVLTVNGNDIVCHKGESIISLRTWAKHFGWKLGKTRCFFAKLEKTGFIKIIHTEYGINIIRVNNYEIWTQSRVEENMKRKTKSEELFEVFWNQYHEITQTPKREIGAARKAWNKLTGSERNTAVKSIYAYYMSMENTNYIKRACNYLSDKSFLNEDIY